MSGEGSKDFERLSYEGLEALSVGGREALEALLAKHPEHAQKVRAGLERLERLGLAGVAASTGAGAARASGESASPTTGAGAVAATGAGAPDRMGGFRLIRRIGEGGMGLVWEAEDVALGRRVALKMVRPEQLWFPGARERFRREVEAVARLQHPGIVPVYSVGEEGGVPFFAMELLDGCTLADVLRVLRGSDPARLTGRDLARAIEEASPRREGVPAARGGAVFEGSWIQACVQIARQVADALDHAHGRELVHRDVKPSNVAITRTGRAMLLDFGLARSDSADRMTRTGSQPGSLPYMSPEQVDATGDLDARTDVYSLGVTLFEMLTLAPAFDDASAEGVRRRILLGEHSRPREHNASIPWDVETVCLTAIERELARRYASVEDFSRDLGNLLAHRPIEARRAGALLRVVRWSQRHPRISAAILAAVPLALTALGGIAWIESQGREREREGRERESLLRGKADENAAAADAERRMVLRLSDVRRLSDLEREADALWPALPKRVDEYDRWLANAGELTGRIDLHREALSALEALPDAVRDEAGAWRLPSTEEQWHHDTLADLIGNLERMAEPGSGLDEDIRARLAFARTIEDRSCTGSVAGPAWDTAWRSIADPDECPAYNGMAIVPQVGLLPIGRDPASGLWEFVHLQTGAAPARGEDGRLVLAPDSGIVFVLLPGGNFLMGSELDPNAPDHDPAAAWYEGPVHELALEPFFLAKHVMTASQWERFTGSVPGRNTAEPIGPLQPVTFVSRDGARTVLSRLGLDLPTEAQWEYACRAGTRTIFWTGDEKETLRGAANLFDVTLAAYAERAERPYEKWLDDGQRYSSRIDAFKANPFGLHDMTGNVFQWCKDAFGSYDNPTNPGDAERLGGDPELMVYRGSAFSTLALLARSGNREKSSRSHNASFIGLRAARRVEG